jgi:hypothetical protein
MLVSLLLRALFIYMLFTFARSLWRSYKLVQGLKHTGGSPKSSRSTGDSVEAEYRVVKEQDT